MTAIGASGAAMTDNPSMHRLRNSRWTRWVGIILVLLPLLAPTLSHALRHAAALKVPSPMAGVVCLPGLVSSTAASLGDVAAVEVLRHDGAVDAGLHACGYCACPAFGHSLPAVDSGFTPTGQPAVRVTSALQRERLATRIERPRARSPPLAA